MLVKFQKVLLAKVAEAGGAGALPLEGAFQLAVVVQLARVLADARIALQLAIGLLQPLLFKSLVTVIKNIDAAV
jgi:hypothetical protein